MQQITSFSRSVPANILCAKLEKQPNVNIDPDSIITPHECWIDFEFQGHQFAIHDQFDEYWCFAKAPQRLESILTEVSQMLKRLLNQG